MSHADEIEDAKGLYDYAKQLELQMDELKRQSKTDVEVMGEISRCRDVGFARLDVANRLIHDLQCEKVRLRKALSGFVDEECHCHEDGVVPPCVQCEARAALEATELDRTEKRVRPSPECEASAYTPWYPCPRCKQIHD